MGRLPYLRLGLLAGALALSLPAAAEQPSPVRQQALLHLLRHDCGSCHGMTLQGGLGPPLLPARIAAFDPQALAMTILYGRPGTPMPPWRGFLTEAEAAWLVEQLQRGIPDGR